MPSNNNESTMKWKVDIQQLKASMQDAKRSIALANAEFKTATAGIGKWSSSINGLEAKLAQLNKTLPQQKSILAQLQKQYEITADALGENSAEAQKLLLQIENQKAAIGRTEASIERYNDQLSDLKEEQIKADSEMGKLSSTISDQESKLSDLKDAYAEAVLKYGENSDEAQELAGQIQQLSGELVDNRNTLKDAQDAADQFDQSLEDTEDEAENATEGFTVMKGALADLVAKGITAAINGMKKLAQETYNAWKAVDSGADAIIAATGASGEAAEDLMDVYDRVSSNVVADFGEIGSAVGEVNTRFGLTGDELEDVTTKFIKFSKLNNTSVKSSIDSVQSAMAAWNMDASKAGDFLDVLNKAGQDTGVSVDQLSSLLKSNSAALQEMGMSVSDAAMFLANLDKNGVDTSVALAGLRKGLQNAIKEGKPMSEAMADIETSIKYARTETDAIRVATELFGAKAGASIAKAVRSGRLSFESFGTTLTSFRGNVESTYDALLDAPDEIQLEIQKLRKTAAGVFDEFLRKYAPKITSLIKDFSEKTLPKVSDAAGKLFDFFDKNGQKIIGVIKAIALAFVTYKAVGIIESVVTAFGALTKAIKAGDSIMKAFNSTMLASPIALVAAAVAGLVSWAISYNKAADEAAKNTDALTESQRALVDQINEETTAWQESKDARLESNQAIEASFGYYQNLWDRLQEITDEQGVVKTGYEDEAKVITDTLGEALDIEFENRGWQIKNYQAVRDEIDKLIIAKKAEALIEANSGAYAEAIQKQADAFAEYNQVLADSESTYSELQDAQAELNRLLDIQNSGQHVNTFTMENAKSAVDRLSKAYDEQSEAVNAAYERYLDYGNLISNYNELSKAVANGGVEELNQAIMNLSYSFQTAETATSEMLQKQYDDFTQQYENMQAAVEEGMVGVTQEQVDQLAKLRDAAKKELDKSLGVYQEAGEEQGEAYAKGLESTDRTIKGAGAKVRDDLIAEIEAGESKAGSVGKDTGNEYAASVENTKERARQAGKSVANSAESGASEVSMKDTGETAGNQYQTGLLSYVNSVKDKGIELANKALEGLASISATKAGEDFASGFSGGIGNLTQKVKDAATRLANNAISAMKKALDSNSPSKVTERIGFDYDRGFAGGILDKAGLAVSAAKSVAQGAVNALKADMSSAASGITTGSTAAVVGAGGNRTQNVTFNQYNTSPKALDRLTIYRDTNNMLFAARVRLNNV